MKKDEFKKELRKAWRRRDSPVEKTREIRLEDVHLDVELGIITINAFAAAYSAEEGLEFGSRVEILAKQCSGEEAVARKKYMEDIYEMLREWQQRKRLGINECDYFTLGGDDPLYDRKSFTVNLYGWRKATLSAEVSWLVEEIMKITGEKEVQSFKLSFTEELTQTRTYEYKQLVS